MLELILTHLHAHWGAHRAHRAGGHRVAPASHWSHGLDIIILHVKS